MFDALKYIVNELGDFMVFSPTTHHKTAYRAMSQHSYETCVGAGFIYFKEGKVSCGGYSESLGIKSRGRVDAKIIASRMNLEVAE